MKTCGPAAGPAADLLSHAKQISGRRRTLSANRRSACLFVGFAINVLLLSVAAANVWAETRSPEDLLSSVDEILYPDSCVMTVELTVHRPSRPTTTTAMQIHRKAGTGTHIRMTAPERVAGTRILAKDGEMWMYNPASNADTPIPLADRGAFQGTVFSNEDMTDAQLTERYKAVQTTERTIDVEDRRVECYVVRAEANKEEAAYGRMMIYVRKQPLLPVRIDLYSHSDVLFKRMHLEKPEDMGGRLRPSVLRVESLQAGGSSAVLKIQDVELTRTFPDGIFSTSNLTETQ